MAENIAENGKCLVEVMVFCKCFVSGGKGLLLHTVRNPRGVTSSGTLPASHKLLFASCPHPGPPAQEQPPRGTVLPHGASSHELLTIGIIFMGWKEN